MVCVEDTPASRCVEVEPNVKIFAQVEGDGNRTIVLVHGWGFNHEMWKCQVPYLKEHGYKVVAVDLRGFGNSDRSPAGYSYETWANDIGAVIKKLKLKHVTLAGYSIGGAISMYYVSKGVDPAVKRLALIAAAGPFMARSSNNPYGLRPEVFKELIRLIDSMPRYDRLIDSMPRYDAFERIFEIAYPDVAVRRGTWLRFEKWLYNMFKSASKEALVGGLKEMQNQDLRQDLSDIHIETRIFHGKQDKLVSPKLAEEQQRRTGAKLTWFWLSGHGLFFEWEKEKLCQGLDW